MIQSFIHSRRHSKKEQTLAIRVSQAAEILDVSPQTVRNFCNTGMLKYRLNTANQRVFDKDELIASKRKRQGLPPLIQHHYFYVRTSSKQDVSLENQISKLEDNYDVEHTIFKDVSSGLSDKRKGLNALFKELESTDGKKVVYVTNKDRLTRFGFRYIERYFSILNTEIVVLDSDDTKEPHEVLMQDFMSLLASFSGKFYRLRGWEQRKKFLRDVQEEVHQHS